MYVYVCVQPMEEEDMIPVFGSASAEELELAWYSLHLPNTHGGVARLS